MTETIPDFTATRSCPFDPPDGAAELRERGPVARVRLFDGTTPWLITGHAEGRALLSDPRVSSDRSRPNFPMPIPIPAASRPSNLTATLITNDPPVHSRLRRMVIPSFTVRKIAALRPKIEHIVTERLDAMIAAGPPADLLADFALPVPSMVICELLGVPYEDHAFFEEQSRRRLDADGNAMANLYMYLHDLVQKKIDEPGQGLLDDLIAEQLAEGQLDHGELAAMGMVMLIAGHDTTANMISLGTMLLLTTPDQLAKVREDEAAVPGAVEELLRYLTIAGTLARVATEDIELGGQTIKAGEGVMVATAIADREQSDELDVANPMRHHLAFGFGIHQCLGQNLARAELEIAFTQLFRRIPTLRLTMPVDEVPRRENVLLSGVTELPVTW
ncbi:cytochrome P450 [Kutzneria chonburiensis]|uniref:Cytochrome P450 n=1 Tax=Kutzneria chonburiensis TaxID=1483604 RepID=A0ABV6MIN9_9PSEU|nr:cytochrome P450 [Kutzneria chonburiensis]